MFMLSWIRSSDTQAAKASVPASASASSTVDQKYQDDWVLLPADEEAMMNASISDLQLLSASTMTLRPSTSHPASTSRTTTSATTATTKSRRQLKQEMRLQQAQEDLERRPRYDPMIAKMRDYEFKLAKMNKLGMRSGRISSSNTGGAHSFKSMRGSSASGGSSGPQMSSSPKV
ncbi:hypothetical protein BGX29_007002 [Mortierella sp. GBA35]|nr:hypothetical protein BGX23_010566 [Mortierella sp. AD031]KAF9099645.1 hypothetical protein BGX29_007002 [Mortierella sp. GBA35]KAG0211012.1 hypothetical protein BGX33_004567 [Mortierella sp. NVP41]